MRATIVVVAVCALLNLPGALAASPKAEEVIHKLRPHFMLGLASGPGDGWIEETRKQGALWDVRYQYICGGVNTPSNWKTWNQPAGAFAAHYLSECGKTGVIPCFSYYQMLQSLPGGAKGGEDTCNKINCENAGTMKAYFEDLKLLFQECGKFGKTVILHHEPDLWGYFRISQVFSPNDPDKVKVMVKSSGCAEAADFADTAAGFCQALVALRDKYAPNVLLAWHASKWGNPDTKKMADFCLKSGKWDMLFTDPSDRDSAWKLAHNYHAEGAWWSDKDFASFRDWSGELYKLTGLPLIAWQIPIGNTYMASCNNTEGHFMDNRPEYFLEKYPENAHIAEWAAHGYVGLLFGGGAGGCTSRDDAKKDGITNPEPVKDNKGEKALYADDDGGYLRLRGVNYYQKGPLPLLAPATPAAKPAEKTAQAAPKTPRPEPKKMQIPQAVMDEWQARLITRINAALKEGKKPAAFVHVGNQVEKYGLLGADDRNLRVDIQNNAMPVGCKTLPVADLVSIAKALLRGDDDAEGLLSVAVFLYADGQTDPADEHVAKAALKDAKTAEAFKATLGAAK
ncbi:MAG: hypothetical protein NTW87_22140 [Planctomycetota bacterium]|nr:hypothetical protein [Planctomycetota bacterium]